MLLTNKEIKQKAIVLLGGAGKHLNPDDFRSKKHWENNGYELMENQEPYFTLEQLIPIKYILEGNSLTYRDVIGNEKRDGFKAVPVKLYHISQVRKKEK